MEQDVSVAPEFKAPAVRTITATFELTSPMFMAGGKNGGKNGGNAAPELRPTAIKGALRFWWRALNWPRIRLLHNNQHNALVQLHAEECELFGAAHKENARPVRGASRVSVQLKSADLKVMPENHSLPPGLQYLAGQGLWGSLGKGQPIKLKRRAFQAGGQFQLNIQAHSAINDAQWQQLNQTVQAFGLLGCLGSKARNGFGSVVLQNVSGATFSIPGTLAEYQAAVRQLFSGAAGLSELPPLTALSACSRVDISLTERSDRPASVLDQVGDRQNAFRSFKSDKQHPDARRDHNGVLNAVDQHQGQDNYQPQRTVFGLPHNYYFSHRKLPVPFNVFIDRTSARRASPLFIHQHRIGDQYLVVQILLPALFLPAGADMHLGKERFRFRPEDLNWPLLHAWLDGFDKRVCLVEGSREVPNG
ncbi:MAG: type III-B CRISPR module RAMP protein Cmr1 [Marinobacterium sp.]|nr:type III-B CRISPR module RAMP protein Cmr1 [Marinobacterium sp.]